MKKDNEFLAYDEFEDENNDVMYDETNEDDCYEFGGTDEDRKNSKNTTSSLGEEIIALALVIAFVAGVFYYAFNNI